MTILAEQEDEEDEEVCDDNEDFVDDEDDLVDEEDCFVEDDAGFIEEGDGFLDGSGVDLGFTDCFWGSVLGALFIGELGSSGEYFGGGSESFGGSEPPPPPPPVQKGHTQGGETPGKGSTVGIPGGPQ